MIYMTSLKRKPAMLVVLLLLSGSLAAQSHDNIVAFANCALLGEGLDFDKYKLEDSDIDGALRSSNTGPVTQADIDQFRQYISYSSGCVADEAKTKAHLAGYIVSEVLTELSKSASKPVQIGDLKRSRAERDCEKLDVIMDRGGSESVALEKIGNDFQAWLRQHPFLGNPDIGNKSLEEIKWRAYEIGRKRFEIGKQPLVDSFVQSFAQMRSSKNSIPSDLRSTPLFYLLDGPYFPDKRIPLFGVNNAHDKQPLDFLNYIVRRRVWNYVMTGRYSPSKTLEDAMLKDMAAVPEIDLTPYLMGKAPGSEQCKPRSGSWISAGMPAAMVYDEITKDAEASFSSLWSMVNDRIAAAHGGYETHQGSRSFRALVTPHFFPKTDARECVAHFITAQVVTDTYDEHGALVKTSVKTEEISDADTTYYDARHSGPAWTPSLSAALNSRQALSEAQKQAIMTERVMQGSFKSYIDGVKLHLADRCETEWEGFGAVGRNVPKTKVLRSKLVAGQWRDER